MNVLLTHRLAREKAKGWGADRTVFGPDKQSRRRDRILVEENRQIQNV
jgi:hypothetical protein